MSKHNRATRYLELREKSKTFIQKKLKGEKFLLDSHNRQYYISTYLIINDKRHLVLFADINEKLKQWLFFLRPKTLHHLYFKCETVILLCFEDDKVKKTYVVPTNQINRYNFAFGRNSRIYKSSLEAWERVVGKQHGYKRV